jgi:DNA modification methylase
VKIPAFLDRVFNKSCADMSDIPDGAINCIVTSPPYEDQRDYSDDAENHGNYRGDAFIAKMRAPMRELFRVLKDNGSAFINFVPGRKDGVLSSTLHTFPMLLEESGFKIAQVLSWVKTNAQPVADARILKNAAESIYHVVKGGHYIVNKDAIRRPSLWASRDHRSSKYNPLGADGGNWLCPALERLNKMSVQEVLGAVLDPEGSVLPLKKTQDQATVHKAKMPDELADWLILYGSRAGDVVLDPWAGSGTSLCRAKAHGRHFVGYELVAAYAALSEQRLAAVLFGAASAADGTVSSARPPASDRASSATTVPAVKRERLCKRCGEPFTPKRQWQDYCKQSCRDAHNNARKKHPEKGGGDNGANADAV